MVDHSITVLLFNLLITVTVLCVLCTVILIPFRCHGPTASPLDGSAHFSQSRGNWSLVVLVVVVVVVQGRSPGLRA